jgi:hypothetical protein
VTEGLGGENKIAWIKELLFDGDSFETQIPSGISERNYSLSLTVWLTVPITHRLTRRAIEYSVDLNLFGSFGLISTEIRFDQSGTNFNALSQTY